MCQRWLKIEAPQGELRGPTAGAHVTAFSSEAIGEFNGVVGTFPALAPSAQKERFGEKGRPWNSPITAWQNYEKWIDFDGFWWLVQLHSRININSQPYHELSPIIFGPTACPTQSWPGLLRKGTSWALTGTAVLPMGSPLARGVAASFSSWVMRIRLLSNIHGDISSIVFEHVKPYQFLASARSSYSKVKGPCSMGRSSNYGFGHRDHGESMNPWWSSSPYLCMVVTGCPTLAL